MEGDDDSDCEINDNHREKDPLHTAVGEVSREDSELVRAKKEINDLKIENVQLKNLNFNLQTILAKSSASQ